MKKYAISFLFSCLLPFFLNGFDIVKDGQATAYITAADELPSRVMESIERFRNDVRELTAAEIPWRQPKENKMEIIHIKCNIDSDNVAAISFPDKNTMRIEGGTYGLARIFPFLLERFAGVVYLYPGKNGTHYPIRTMFFLIRSEPNGQLTANIIYPAISFQSKNICRQNAGLRQKSFL